MQIGQFWAGFDAELIDQQAAGGGVDRQCLAAAAAVVQGGHPQSAQTFTQREFRTGRG
ncbi:hypothetical protein GCM10027167_65970 [Nocardia heshunensis]